MAGNPGPMTYTNYYQSLQETYEKGTADSFIANKSIITQFSIETKNVQKRQKKRFIGNFPTPTYLPIGAEPPAPFVTDKEEYSEGVYLIRDDYDYDELFESDDDYTEGNIHQEQLDIYMKARVWDLNFKFFNNTGLNNGLPNFLGTFNDPMAPIGLKWRLATGAYGVPSSCTVQAGFSVAFGGWSGANTARFGWDLETLFDHMGIEDGNDAMVFLNPQTWRGLNATIKSGGTSAGFAITKDSFDRTIIKYQGATLVDVGYNAPDINGNQVIPVISSIQDINGWDLGDPLYNPTGAIYTSVYVVNKSKFSTWQKMKPMTRKIPLAAATRKTRIMLDMTFGIWMPDTRAIGRLIGIATNGNVNANGYVYD